MNDNAKVAVVVGAGEYGIASALALVDRGVQVALLAESFDEIDGNVNETIASGKIMACITSFLDIPNVQKTIDQIAGKFGRIDILVNAALEKGPDGFWNIKEEDFQRCIRINMKLPFFVYQACANHMRTNGGGRIINLSSTFSAVTDGEHQIVYGMTKAGVNSLTRQWAVDQCLENIQANSLWIGSEESGQIPEARQVADFVEFLALDASPFINAAQIQVDGGAYMLHQGKLL